MELADILKIVLPVIVALCGTVYATLRWTLDRQAKSQQDYWKTMHAGLVKQIDEHSARHEQWQANASRDLDTLGRTLNEFRIKVAEEYIKREDWLEHAVGLERKVDQLRIDVGKELQALGREVAKFGGAK